MRAEYTVSCTRCGAARGQACHSPAGNWANPHGERHALTGEAWRLGYADGVAQYAKDTEHLLSMAEFIWADVAKRIEADR